MKTTRRVLKQDTEKLNELLPKYEYNKKEAASFKKVADSYNVEIKDIMINNDMTEFVGDDLQAKISITPKEDFNELQAIEILRKNLNPDLFERVVKVKEYIDFDILEDEAYNKNIDVSILAPCTTPKPPVVTLRISKAKK